MTFLLRQLFKLINLIHSETGTFQIASGIAAGFVLGMAPAFSLQTLLIFAMILIFRVQFGAAMLAAFFFKIVAYILDPLFHEVGTWFLELSSLQPTFTWMYNAPFVPLTRFNNTVVMGAGVVSIILFPFILVLSAYLLKRYRETVVARWKNSAAFKAIKATKFYGWYESYRNARARFI